MRRDPGLLTTSTNRNLFQPTRDQKSRRRTEIRDGIQQGKRRSSSRNMDGKGAIQAKMTREHSSSSSSHSDRSQLVDLVVEDTDAEEAERVRARKEGGDSWNRDEQKHFVRTYDPHGDDQGEAIRQGFDPTTVQAADPPKFAVEEDSNDASEEEAGNSNPLYGSLNEERHVWDSPTRQS